MPYKKTSPQSVNCISFRCHFETKWSSHWSPFKWISLFQAFSNRMFSVSCVSVSTILSNSLVNFRAESILCKSPNAVFSSWFFSKSTLFYSIFLEFWIFSIFRPRLKFSVPVIYFFFLWVSTSFFFFVLESKNLRKFVQPFWWIHEPGIPPGSATVEVEILTQTLTFKLETLSNSMCREILRRISSCFSSSSSSSNG